MLLGVCIACFASLRRYLAAECNITAYTSQERQALLVGDGFIKAARGSKPFSHPAFQQLVADVVGVNQEIRAPVIAFIAYKLGNLLIDSSWNVLGQKLDDSRDTGVGYVRYLDIAIAQRGITIAATIPADDDTEPRQTWLRIVHDTQARK